MFQKATKHEAKLRFALIGPAGSGKTYTALRIGTRLGERVAVIDTERGSASKYADVFDFDVVELTKHDPREFVKAIRAAQSAGYDALIIDSLSHAWMGRGGALELVDKAAKGSSSSNSFAAWRSVTPLHNELVDAIAGANLHVIATMRSKMKIRA
jgi:flagellar biosynthesis GTPase FlhF